MFVLVVFAMSQLSPNCQQGEVGYYCRYNFSEVRASTTRFESFDECIQRRKELFSKTFAEGKIMICAQL